jgi:hypothetical protein
MLFLPPSSSGPGSSDNTTQAYQIESTERREEHPRAYLRDLTNSEFLSQSSRRPRLVRRSLVQRWKYKAMERKLVGAHDLR